MNQIKWSGMTHPGRFRQSNQDAFLGLILYKEEAHYLGKEDSHPIDENQFIFAVSDGMGGANAGDFASKLALQSVTKRLPTAIKEQNSTTPESRKKLLDEIINNIHEELFSVSRYYDECKGMGATLSLCWVRPDGTGSLAHVGDSRIYKIPKQESIVQLSEDHSEVGRMFKKGLINEREAKQHPKRSILEQAIGAGKPGKRLEPQIEEFNWKQGDHLILCSDGICDGLFNASIEKTVVKPIRTLSDVRASERLIKESMFSSGRDNLTSMVIEFT